MVASTLPPPRREKGGGGFERGFLLGKSSGSSRPKQTPPSRTAQPNGDRGATKSRISVMSVTGTMDKHHDPNDPNGRSRISESSVIANAAARPKKAINVKPSPQGATGWTKGFLNSSKSLSSSSPKKKVAAANSGKATPNGEAKVVVSKDLLEIDDAAAIGTGSSTGRRTSTISSLLDLKAFTSQAQNDDDDVENLRSRNADRTPLISILHEEDGGDDPDCRSDVDDETSARIVHPLLPFASIVSPASQTPDATMTSADESSSNLMWTEVATTRKGGFLLGSTDNEGTVPRIGLAVNPTTQKPLPPQDTSNNAVGGTVTRNKAGLVTDCTFDFGSSDYAATPIDGTVTASLLPTISSTLPSPSSPPPPSESQPGTPSASIMEFQQELERLVWQRINVYGRDDRGRGSSHPQGSLTSQWTIPQARWAWQFCLLQQRVVRHDAVSSSHAVSSSRSKTSNNSNVSHASTSSRTARTRALEEIAMSLVLSHLDTLCWILKQNENEEGRRVALQAIVWLKRYFTQCSTTDGKVLQQRNHNPIALAQPPVQIHVCSILLPPMVDLAVHPQRTMLAQSAWEAAIMCIANWMEYTFTTSIDLTTTRDTIATEREWGHLQSLLDQQLSWQRAKKDATKSTKIRIEKLKLLQLKFATARGIPTSFCEGGNCDKALAFVELARDMKQLVCR